MVPCVALILVGFISGLDWYGWLCLSDSRLAMVWWIDFTCQYWLGWIHFPTVAKYTRAYKSAYNRAYNSAYNRAHNSG